MAERQVFIDRVKGAEPESYVVAAVVSHYGNAVQAGDAQLPSVPTNTSPRDLATAADKVESTYLVRMWAEYLATLSTHQMVSAGRVSRPLWKELEARKSQETHVKK